MLYLCYHYAIVMVLKTKGKIMLVADVAMVKSRIERRLRDVIAEECDVIREEMKSDNAVVSSIQIAFEEAHCMGQPIDAFLSEVACELIVDGVRL